MSPLVASVLKPKYNRIFCWKTSIKTKTRFNMENSKGAFEYAFDFRPSSFRVFRRFFVSVRNHFIPHSGNDYHPHILSHRMMALLATLVVTIKVTGIALGVLLPVERIYASDITVEHVVSLANVSRAENELSALELNSVLSRAAQAKADDMMLKQYFSHNTPEGYAPWKFIKDAGYSYIAAGENLAIDFHDAETMQSAWMNSPGHRANILNKNFQEIGVGIASGFFEGKKSTIVVQMFGTPIAQQVALAVNPTILQNVIDGTKPVAAPPEITQAKKASQPVILQTNHSVSGDAIRITVATDDTPVKVMAQYGDKAIMLDPIAKTAWFGLIPVASLGQNANLVVTAYDINGVSSSQEVLQTSPIVNDPSGKAGSVGGVNVTFLGKIFNPQILEQNIFWGITLLLLISLLIGIAVERKVQHVGMIANASFVAMLACIFTMS